MALRVPPELQEIEKALALKRWTTRRSFPRDVIFGIIDKLIESLENVTDAARPEALAAMLARILDEDGALLNHLLSRNTVSISGDPAMWDRCTGAAAWVVLQRYYREKENGEWP